MDNRQHGQTEQNGLFPMTLGTPSLEAGDGLQSSPRGLEEGRGGTNDSFLRRREQRRQEERKQECKREQWFIRVVPIGDRG